MKFLKVALYCLGGLSFACLFIFIGMAISHISENGISASSDKIQVDGENVNSGNSVGDMQVTFNNQNDKILIEELPGIMLITDVDNFIEVGDTVTFEVLSDNSNIEKNSVFYYDFDGNGIWDLVTKQNKIKYTYTDSYEKGVTPRAAVEYEGNFVQVKGETILVVEEEWVVAPILSMYEKNKQEILSFLPTDQGYTIKSIIEEMFKNYEDNYYSYLKPERAKSLNKIWNTIIEYGMENKGILNEEDFTPYFCGIFDYYDILDYTKKCETAIN